MDGDLDYYELYRRMSPAVDRYLDRYPLYPWQGLDRPAIDRMVDDLYNEVANDFPELKSIKKKGAHSAQYGRGLAKTLLGLVLLGSLFRRYPYYGPGYGPWYGPGYGPGPVY
jgi:hypothetical protein